MMPKKKTRGGEKEKTQLKKKCCYCKTQVLFKDKEKKSRKKWKYGAGGEERSDNAAAKQLWQEMTGSKWKK